MLNGSCLLKRRACLGSPRDHWSHWHEGGGLSDWLPASKRTHSGEIDAQSFGVWGGRGQAKAETASLLTLSPS